MFKLIVYNYVVFLKKMYGVVCVALN